MVRLSAGHKFIDSLVCQMHVDNSTQSKNQLHFNQWSIDRLAFSCGALWKISKRGDKKKINSRTASVMCTSDGWMDGGKFIISMAATIFIRPWQPWGLISIFTFFLYCYLTPKLHQLDKADRLSLSRAYTFRCVNSTFNISIPLFATSSLFVIIMILYYFSDYNVGWTDGKHLTWKLPSISFISTGISFYVCRGKERWLNSFVAIFVSFVRSYWNWN